MQRSTALSSQQGELRHAATGLNALVRVTFIRSLNGIGDSLNGLASAWLLSQFFGVEFSVSLASAGQKRMCRGRYHPSRLSALRRSASGSVE